MPHNEEAARLAQPQSENSGFDAKDKGSNAIVEADGASCTGKQYGEGNGHWSVACGEPIGGGGEGRIAVKATKAEYGNAMLGVLSSTASREDVPGLQEGGIGLDSDGNLYVNGKDVRTVKGFRDGDLLGAAVLRADGERVVAFYVNGEEVARQPLPDGEYRLAVGGNGDSAAFEIVDAAASAAFWAEAERSSAAGGSSASGSAYGK